MPDKTLIIVAGPTAIGKTALAIRIAREFDTEIISADSRQFYREMDIGTAKPSPQELQAAKHHFINSHSIKNEFSVGDFEKEALEVLAQIFSKHPIAVMVGGSGLYINAIAQGFDELPKASAETREKLNQLFRQHGIIALQEKLQAVDPVYYQEVDIQNPQRLIRALEVWETTQKPFSEYRTRKVKKRPFNMIKIGLTTSREQLYQRINHRVDLMVEASLVQEAERLLPYRDYNALQTVGYSELFDYFDGHISLDEAIDKIKQNTRRFAKRQLTWFKKTEDIAWFEPDDYTGIDAYLTSKLKP